MKTWTAFNGVDAADGWDHLDISGATWTEARNALIARLRPFLHDTCDECRSQGTEALDRLLETESGDEFWAEVDGEEYRLVGHDL